MAERQRRRTGMWTNTAGRLCQHCPACHAVIAAPAPTGIDRVWEPNVYTAAVADQLDDAVYHHLFYGLCPIPENVV